MKIGEIVGPSFVYQTESTILRVAVRTAAADDGFLNARRQAREWLQVICRRQDLDIPAGNDVAVGNDRCGVDLIVRPERMVAVLRHYDERFPERVWFVNVDLRADDGGDVAICDLRLRAEHPSNARPIDPFPSRLIGALCSNPGLKDVELMRSSSMLLRPADVARAVSLINAPERRMPVILASRPLALDVNTVARELSGLAHVFELDGDASWEISRRYDKRYSAYLGAVKMYPAGITFASEPEAAPLFFPQTLQMLARERKAESTVRRGVLADLTAQFEAEPLLTPGALRAQEAAASRALTERPATVVESPAKQQATAETVEADVWALAEQEVHRARQEAAAARQEAEGYWREILRLSSRVEELEAERDELRETELGVSVEELSPGHRDLLRMIFGSVNQMREALLENDRLLDQIDQLRSEYETLRVRLARSYEREDEPAPAAPAEAIPFPAWDDFEALKAWAEHRYRGALVFHPRVRDRLADGNLQDGVVMFDILDVLATDYVAMKRGVAGARERYVERTQRYKAGKALTDVGAGLTGEDYNCTFDGVRYGGEDHNHIRERGRNFTGRTVCVYFVYDEAKGRVVVTSMPRHLESVSGRT